MNKYFHGFLMGVSVLPALAIMPAMAVNITANMDLSETFPDGNVDWIDTRNGFTGTLIVPEISVIDDVLPLYAGGTGSTLIIGDMNTTNSLSVNNPSSAESTYAVVSDGNGVVNLAARDISINAGYIGLFASNNGTLNIDSGNNLSVSSGRYGITVKAGGIFEADANNNMTITAVNGDGIKVQQGGTVDIHTKNLTISSSYTDVSDDHNNPGAGISTVKANGVNNIDISATDTISITASGDSSAIMMRGTGNKDMQSGHLSLSANTINLVNDSDEHATLHVANYTSDSEDQSKRVVVNLDANNINIEGAHLAVAVMSQGILNINGNTKISADKAIVARGDAQLRINKDTENTLQMDGNIDFNYSGTSSGTGVDALVDITMSGANSYWNGNVTASHASTDNPSEADMTVTSMYLTMKNGAVWNAAAITETEEVANIALNYLTIEKGTVNIADTTKGLYVENANIADATFNGGKLNVGTLALTGGTNTFNNDVVGIDNSSSLNVGSNSTMNIGTNTVNVNSITLDGTMLATLRDGDAQITAGTFDGNGTLKLSLAGAGTYHVFGDSTFRAAGIDATSSVYDISWANEDKDLVATLKSVEDIAAENGIQEDTAAVLAGASQSSSQKLNDLAVKMQEKLAEDTVEAKQEVEKAAAAVHPEKESVTQSIAASVQTTVANLTGARMRMVAPRIGRNGGDVRLTSGGVWAQGLFNKSKQNDAFRGYTRGVAAGMDGTINKAWTIGAGYSYAHSDINGTERDTEIDSNTIFVYGQYKPTQWYVNAVLNYTMSDFSEEGVVMGTPVTGDYDVNSFGGVIATGYDFASGVTPELGLRYMHVMADDYTNSMDVKTKSKDTDFLTGVFGAKYAFGINMDRYTKLIPQLNAAVKYDMLSDRNISTVTMPGVDSYTLRGERLSRLGGEFGIGLGLKYKTVDFSINYDIDVRKDYTSQTGMLKFRYNF